MHTPMHRKYAIAWRIGGAASREGRTSLLDFWNNYVIFKTGRLCYTLNILKIFY